MSYEELLAENTELKQTIALLEFQIKEFKRLIFGSKSERHISEVPNQINLFTESVPEVLPEPEKEIVTYQRNKAKKHPGRSQFPDHLPVEETIIQPDTLTEDMKQIGQDVTDTLKFTPASLIIKRTIRPKYKTITDQQESIVQAPAPSRPLPRCMAEPCLLAYIIVSKFIDHLPFYRQIQRFKRDYSWKLSKSTINDWFIAVCTLLEPLYDTMANKVLESEYIQADESHIKVQDVDKKGATHTGWQWVYRAPLENIVLFKYDKSRSINGPKEFFKQFNGSIQCDGYGVYDKIGKIYNINLVGCAAHARRYFDQAKDNDRPRAGYALGIYRQIYSHEKQCKDMTPDQRKEYRLIHLAPLMAQLKNWMDEQALVVLPKSPMGKAITYHINQWPKLMAILEDGRLELDNNLIENKIRPLALGRKNYLFAGSHEAAQRIAMMYTFFATCKANDVNPYKWLKHTLEVISDYKVKDLAELIPGKCTLPE